MYRSLTLGTPLPFQCGGFDAMVLAYSEMLQELTEKNVPDTERCSRYIQIGKIL